MSNKHSLVDIDFATSQLGGNSELLARMLGKFCDEFSSTPQSVIDALANGDKHEAKMKVHTTKGLSGNLGLLALFECSKVLDQQIRDDNIDDSQLDAFVHIMAETIACVKNLDLSQSAPTEYTTSTLPSSSDVSISEKAAFIKRLERNEFIDDDTLYAYIDALPFNEDEKKTLQTLVEELQYAKAIEMINGVC